MAAAGNLRHQELLDMLRRRMDTGRIVRSGDPQGWNLRASETAPESSAKPLVKRRKTEQAHICLGTNGLARSDPDRFPFLIVNGALGTGMSSRLFQEIREKRGLVYSVKGSMVLSLEDPGSRMSRIGKSEIAHGEILTVNQSLKRVEDVSLEDARRVAKRVLSQPMTLTVLGPFAQRDLAGVMS